MQAASYDSRRQQLEEYFDRTAVDAWAKLTSDAPVSGIRATVRAGRDRMRALLLSYLPDDMHGQRVLDAGCGTGALAVEAARRGADVVAIDHSPKLIALAQERAPHDLGHGRLTFVAGDMLDASLGRLGRFDWVVAMDSIIHYQPEDMVSMISQLALRADRGLAFTFAPRTPLLTMMQFVGKAFPRGNRSPDIVPIAERALRERIMARPSLAGFSVGRTERVDTSFYKSQAMELVRA